MKRRILLLAIASLGMFGFSSKGRPRNVGLKTNLLYWSTSTPNLALEVGLGPQTTLDIQGSYNPFRFGNADSNSKLLHWMVIPELRMWTCEKFTGHFFGVHGLFNSYNAGNINLPFGIFSGLKENRYKGYGIGAGLSYGYRWSLSPRWNLEAQFGCGYVYLNYERYECLRCGSFIEKTHKHYFGPTKIGLSFIYHFKSKK